MKQTKSFTIAVFEDLEAISIPGSKASILTEIEGQLGEKDAGQFTLSWAEFGAIRRHIEFAKRNKQKPRFEVKVLSFKGKGKTRTYDVAIARNK